MIATIFAGVLPWRGNRLRDENGRDLPRRLCASKQAGPAKPGLWFKRFCWVPMASSAIMERSASNRAIVAAGGTAIALKLRPADIQLSGSHTNPGTQRRGLP
ncbi:hypothetical protein, partial [Mesorhizobium sp.]|uniref:hypothetical protein n=1 Tax=Mesorhizobium sp. TaxID=1871066 RepID=UPI0025C1BF56